MGADCCFVGKIDTQGSVICIPTQVSAAAPRMISCFRPRKSRGRFKGEVFVFYLCHLRPLCKERVA